MYKIYFKQAIELLKKNKLMSIIAILGTALAIMMIMSIIVTEEVKNISVAPEINRHRTYYFPREISKDTLHGNSWSSNTKFGTYYNAFRELETPEASAIIIWGNGTLGIEGTSIKEEGQIKYVNPDYFKIISLSFVAGRPFTEEEFSSEIKNAILTESLARKLVKDENPLGRTVVINKTSYNIIGVVKDVSKIFRMAYSDIWLPHTSLQKNPEYMEFLVMAKDNKDFPAIYAEIREREKKYNNVQAPIVTTLVGPVNHSTIAMNIPANSEEEMKDTVKTENRKKLFVIAILLLVPAINLSGFSFSRIKKRTAEIGVRKAFGAKKYVILLQVLYENLITSLIGGLLGLICSYCIIFFMRDWLLDIPEESNIPIETLASPIVFIAVFVLCILINLLSAGIPAWRASNVSITNSINENDK